MHGTASTTHKGIQPQRPAEHQSISVYTLDRDQIETADQGPKPPIGVRKFGLTRNRVVIGKYRTVEDMASYLDISTLVEETAPEPWAGRRA